MAVHESDREDLMREATALRRRCEILVPGEEEPIIAGFRDDDRVSLFFGPDPAFHFDENGRLRRSYCDGRLFRTQGQTLARLTRNRSEGKSELLRHDLSAEELERFVTHMDERLSGLLIQLESGTYELKQQIPAAHSFIPQLIVALKTILAAEPRLASAIKA